MLNMFDFLAKATLETVYMVLVSGIGASFLGIPLGFILFATDRNQVWERPIFHKILSISLNVLRSLPFIILLVMLLPFTRWIIGSTVGTTAAIIPLMIGAIPFIARIVDNALKEVPHGLIEAALSFGATPFQIFYRVLWPEALSNIIRGLTVAMVMLVSFSAMAGTVGGGGLGDVAIRYGYQRFNTTVLIETVVLLIALVQFIQWVGQLSARYWNKR